MQDQKIPEGMIKPTVKQSTSIISRSKLGALERHGGHNNNQPDLQLQGGLQLLLKSKRVHQKNKLEKGMTA